VWCPERYFQLERDCKQCGMPDYLKSELGERAGQVLLKKAEANLPKASVDKPSDLVDGVSRERSRGPLSKLPRSHMVRVRAFSDSPIFRPVARSRPSAIPKRRAPTPGRRVLINGPDAAARLYASENPDALASAGINTVRDPMRPSRNS